MEEVESLPSFTLEIKSWRRRRNTISFYNKKNNLKKNKKQRIFMNMTYTTKITMEHQEN